MQQDQIIIIGIILCISFGVESIFGLGGTIISLAILGFFFDIKEMIILDSFAAGLTSLLIFGSDYKNFNFHIFLKIFVAAIPGIFIGTYFLKSFDSQIILQIFAVFLICYAFWTILSPKFSIAKILKLPINFIGGVFGSLFGTPGPFFVIAMRDVFKNKSEMRATFAIVFLLLSILRIPTYYKTGLLDFDKILPFWWIMFPLLITVWIGHRIHVKLSERMFQVGISVLLGLAGISILI